MINWTESSAPVFFDTDCLACFVWTGSLMVLHIAKQLRSGIMRP
jgi:hypothetical protein